MTSETAAPRVFRIAVSGSRSIASPANPRDGADIVRYLAELERVRAILDERAIYYISQGYEIEFHLGDAVGVDRAALEWARERSIKRVVFFADRKGYEFWRQSANMREWPPAMEYGVLASDWDRDGKMAGPVRNHAMIAGAHEDADGRAVKVAKADLLVAVWDGTSRGTRNAMATARNANVFIHQYGGDGPIAFATPSERDATIVEYKGALDGMAGQVVS